MKVVILCGGQGTRLKEETEYRPKPLVEIGGRPILWHIMKNYAYHGFTEFILCIGYRGNMIKDYFLNYEAMNNDFTICLGKKNHIDYHGAHHEQDFQVTLVDTGNETMTGARIKKIQKYIQDDEFLMTYGDGLSNVNICNLVNFHKSHNNLATVTTVRPISRYGVLDINPTRQVVDFAEKPRVDGWVSAGFFVLNRKIFNYLSDDPGCVFEREPLQELARDNQLMAYEHDGFFYAMDTYREYLYLNDLWNSGRAPWVTWDYQHE